MNTSFSKIHPSLPIFLIEGKRRTGIYTPGYLCPLSQKTGTEIKQFFKDENSNCNIKNLADKLEDYAKKAEEQWKIKTTAPFEPVCLTVYMTDKCNMNCSYCYNQSLSDGKNHVIDEKAVLSASEIVLNFCTKKNHPFLFILHGGGEPSIYWSKVVKLCTETKERAKNSNLQWFGTIITNGIISEKKALWLSENFSHIVLSCDGSPYIQNKSRPLKNNKQSSLYIERTAKIIRENGGNFSIRSTITPETVKDQEDIVTYLNKKLGAVNMRFEPVYNVWKRELSYFKKEYVPIFAENFIKAQKKADSLGSDLTFSGSRLDELHGPYCSICRNVLHIIPPNGITGCFFNTSSTVRAEMITGRFEKNRIIINDKLINSYRNKALTIPHRCYECINIYHCSRECPEICMMNMENKEEGFRCLIQRELTVRWLIDILENN